MEDIKVNGQEPDFRSACRRNGGDTDKFLPSNIYNFYKFIIKLLK